MAYVDELNAGFAELTANAGTTVSFTDANNVTTVMPCIIGMPSPAQMQVELSLGRPYAVRVEIARSSLPATPPTTGATLTETVTGTKYRVDDILKHDVTDPVVIFSCKTVGYP